MYMDSVKLPIELSNSGLRQLMLKVVVVTLYSNHISCRFQISFITHFKIMSFVFESKHSFIKSDDFQMKNQLFRSTS